MKYSIIIPAYNSAGTIERCLDSVKRSPCKSDYEIIVVDDGSSDDTASLAERQGVRVIRHGKNRGRSAARNTGAQRASGEILVFTDADILFHNDTFFIVDEVLNSGTNYVAVSGCLSPKCEMVDVISRYKNLCTCSTFFDQPGSVRWTYTSIFAVEKTIFEQVGGFDESVPFHEDGVLGRDITALGYRIAFEPRLQVDHLHHYTFLTFVRERPFRSRTRMVMRLTNFFKKTSIGKEPVSANMKYSILFSPFLLIGLFLAPLTFFICLFQLFYSMAAIPVSYGIARRSSALGSCCGRRYFSPSTDSSALPVYCWVRRIIYAVDEYESVASVSQAIVKKQIAADLYQLFRNGSLPRELPSLF